MIPKIIHYCWFGGANLPEDAQRCIASWKKLCPDYEIKRWDESNYDVNSNDYIKEAYENQKWAFVSDYARLDIIYQEGGFYLDVDVELIKPLDDFLDEYCVLARETSGYINTGLGFAAEKENPYIKEMLSEYEGKHFLMEKGILDFTPCPRRNTAPFLKYGYKQDESETWEYDNLKVYASEYFCPINYKTQEMKITEKTYSIHHYSALWISEDKRLLNQKIDEVNKRFAKPIAIVMRFQLKYVYYKKTGEVSSFVGFCVFVIKRHYYMWKEKMPFHKS